DLGLMLMLKALVSYQRTEVQLARAQEEDAVRITTEAQRATTAFIDLAKDTEMDSARAINYNNRDSIIVADIYDDVARIVGPIGREYGRTPGTGLATWSRRILRNTLFS